METETIIIDVQLSDEQVAKKLSDTTAEIARLKNEQKQLSQFIKAGADTTGELSKQYAENSQRLRELTAAEKTYTAQLNTTTEDQREYGDSVYQLSAKLADLKNQYRGLSKEQRESAVGEELKKTIQDLDKEVKGLDADLGDHQRNVGNYASALTGLDNRVVKVAAVFQGGFKNGIKAAGDALKSFGKTLLTTPLGWILAAVSAVVAVFKQLRDAFKRNDDASTELSAAMAKLQPILTAIHKVFDALATVVAKVVSGFMSAASAVIGFLVPSFKEASKDAENLVKAEDALEDKQREYTINAAQRQKEISELNKQARSDASLTAAQREEIYKKIDNLEKQDLEERKKIAAENLRIIEAKYKQEVNTSDEAKNAITQARAEMLKAETDYNNATLKIAQRQAAAVKEQVEEAKRRHEEWKKRQEERINKTREAVNALRDLQIEMIKDESQRQEAALKEQYRRDVEALQNRLKTEKNLTFEARKAINQQIILLGDKLAKDLEQITIDRINTQVEIEIAEREKLTDMRIALLTDEYDKEETMLNEQYQRQIDALKKRLETDKDLTIGAREAINGQIEVLEQQLEGKLSELRKKELLKRWDEERLAASVELQRQLIEAGENESKIAAVKLEAAQSYYNNLLTMDEETKAAMFANEQEYTAAVLESQQQVNEAYKANQNALQQQAEQIATTMKSVTASMSDLFEAVAGDSAEYESFRKAMAIVDATISLAEAIAKATAISTEGDPYTMAIRIATNVAAVTAQFAALIASIKSATIPTAPSFAQGGVVGGHSITGDTVMVRANTGEMFINTEDQKKLLDFIQNGIPYNNYELLKAAMIEAYKQAPAPVLDYSEFTGFQKSVKMIERRTKLI